MLISHLSVQIPCLRNSELIHRQRSKASQKVCVKKVQIVLVMSRDAKLYLLDEPMGGVDPAARDYILRTIIENYNEDSTILITTHLISDMKKCSMMWYLSEMVVFS